MPTTMINDDMTQPKTTLEWFNQGAQLQSMNRVDEATDAYRRGEAIADNRDLASACCVNLTNILLSRGETEEAVSFAARAVNHLPDNPNAILLYGLALRAVGKTDDAIRFTEAAIRANDAYGVHWPDVALMYLTQERYREAQEIVRAQVNQHPVRSYHFKTLLEIYDICLSAIGDKSGPITATFSCPSRKEAADLWQEFYQNSEAFRRWTPIVCAGDSHAAFFSGLHSFQYTWPEPQQQWFPHVTGHRIASPLAYSLNKYNTSERGLERLESFLRSDELARGTTIMLSFGEIDIRNHVISQSSAQAKSVAEIVGDCVTAYTHAVNVTLAAGFRAMIWAPPPSRSDVGPYSYMFPTIGSEQERNAATRCFIEGMRVAMEPLGVPVVAIFDELVDETLCSDPRWFMDSCHLNMAAVPHAISAFRKALR